MYNAFFLKYTFKNTTKTMIISQSCFLLYSCYVCICVYVSVFMCACERVCKLGNTLCMYIDYINSNVQNPKRNATLKLDRFLTSTKSAMSFSLWQWCEICTFKTGQRKNSFMLFFKYLYEWDVKFEDRDWNCV